MSHLLRTVRDPMGGTEQTRFGEGPADWLIIREWVDHLDVRGRSERTIRMYRRTVVNFLADNMVGLLDVDERMIDSHLRRLARKGAMRGQTVKALNSLYTFAVRRGYVLENPARYSAAPKPKQRPAPFLDEEQVARVALAAAAHRPEDLRRPWGFLLAYTTGARVQSLCSVLPEDVHRGSIDFRVAKGEKPYRLPLGPIGQAAVDELLELLEYVPRGGQRRSTLLGVGPGQFWNWIHQAGRDAGLHVWPHLCRHTFATELAIQTDPNTWAECMNHSDLSQYRRYAGVYEQRKRDAMASR